MNNTPLISFIIPTYKAESFIRRNLQLLAQFCTDSNLDSEIVVVNDGSPDRTNEEIETFLKQNKNSTPIQYINLAVNKGKGNAVKKGFEASKGKYIVFTDCDLPYSFNNISDVINKLVSDSNNVVVANRMHKDSIYHIRSENLSYIYIRHTSGRIFNRIINFFSRLNIKDSQAGLKGFDRDTAELVFNKMTIDGFSFDVDILTCANENNKTITTVPIEFNYDSEMSTINFLRQIFIMTSGVIKVFIKRLNKQYN